MSNEKDLKLEIRKGAHQVTVLIGGVPRGAFDPYQDDMVSGDDNVQLLCQAIDKLKAQVKKVLPSAGDDIRYGPGALGPKTPHKTPLEPKGEVKYKWPVKASETESNKKYELTGDLFTRVQFPLCSEINLSDEQQKKFLFYSERTGNILSLDRDMELLSSTNPLACTVGSLVPGDKVKIDNVICQYFITFTTREFHRAMLNLETYKWEYIKCDTPCERIPEATNANA